MKRSDKSPRHAFHKEDRSTARELLSWAIYILIAVAIAMLLRFFVFEFVRVDGPSMNPTLESGEAVFVEKVSKITGNFTRGEIVVVSYPNRTESFVKRIIGVPGDTVAITDGKAYLNGQTLDEPYIKEPYIEGDMETVTVPEGHYFVMGDNRNNSSDSRSSAVGPIPAENVIGHAMFIIWPLDQISGLTEYEIALS